MANDYYNYADKIVYDGNLAQAADLNTVNVDVEAAFDLVEADIDVLVQTCEDWAEADIGTGAPGTTSASAKSWATGAEDTEVISGYYSAYHWAQKAEDFVLSGVDDTAYGVSWNGVTTVAASKNAIYDKMETVVLQSDVDDVPVNGVTNYPISSNWAYDHVAAADPHPGYELEDATIIREADVDDVAVDGATVAPISSNWAYDHENDTSTHGITGTILGTEDVDDTPVNGATTAPVSSNWAYDHENDTSTHGVTGTILGTEDVDDTPVDGATTAPVSSNWAYDHVAAADPHPGYELEDATIIREADVDDTPVDGATVAPISSNWAYDHVAAADPHPGYLTPTEGDAAYVQKTSNTGAAIVPSGTEAQRDGTPSAGYLRFNTDEEAFEGYDGVEWKGIGGGGLEYANFDDTDSPITAEKGLGYVCDTTSDAITINLPASPEAGDTIGIIDKAGTFSDNNLTVSPNGTDKVMGIAEDLVLSDDNTSITLVFSDATDGWRIESITPILGTGGGFSWTAISADTTLVPGGGYIVDSWSSALTLTFPLSPAEGDSIAIVDTNGGFALNAVTIEGNGQNIMSSNNDLILDEQYQAYTFVFSGDSSDGWRILTATPGSVDDIQDQIATHSRKNLLINGDFRIYQRGASVTADGYAADRWRCRFGQHSVAANDNTPANYGHSRYLRVSRDGGLSQRPLEQSIELEVTGVGGPFHIGRKLTFSCKARLPQEAGNVRVDFYWADDSGFTNYTSAADRITMSVPISDWTQISGTTTIDADPVGTSKCLIVAISYVPASVTTADLDVANVQLEFGDTATDFEHLSKAEQFATCLRYYWKGTITWTMQTTGSSNYNYIAFPAQMRNVPTLTFSNFIDLAGTGKTINAFTTSSHGIRIQNMSGVGAIGDRYAVVMEADAEL